MHVRRHLVPLLVAAGLAIPGAASVAAPASDSAPPDCTNYQPATKGYFNDPVVAANGGASPTRDVIVCDIKGTVAGATIRLATWSFDDGRIGSALEAADQRGVKVRVIVARAACNNTPSAALLSLKAELNDHSNGSLLTCIKDSARGPEGSGTMHQKSFTFSATRGVSNVTLVGSANLTGEGVDDQYVDMLSYADHQAIFDFYNNVFAIQEQDTSQANPYLTDQFGNPYGKAQMFPVDDPTPTQADDPVLDRIQGIPAAASTTIWVANYAFKDARGNWLKTALINKAKGGATVRVITGPPSGATIESDLAATVRTQVRHGFLPACADHDVDDTASCNYIHLKVMTAEFKDADGAWHRQVWTGSDNWSDASLGNDEAIQLIGDDATYNQYMTYLHQIWDEFAGQGV